MLELKRKFKDKILKMAAHVFLQRIRSTIKEK